MRDPRGTGSGQDDRDHSLRSHSRGSRSPPNVLETLLEDEPPQLHRSASTTSSLRDQMNDLKGRISNLKQKAHEDTMRRRSILSLRSPSPFNQAEAWYSGTTAYKAGASPISADAGVGMTLESPSRKALFEEELHDPTPRTSTIAPLPNDSYAVKEVNSEPTQSPTPTNGNGEPDLYAHPDKNETEANRARTVGLGLGDLGEGESDYVSIQDDEDDDDDFDAGSSVYEDAVYEMPVTERHEDRIDAFDYENFFLHSAMGTYSAVRPGSSGSSSSADSVATTRPVTAIHTRNVSTGSAKRVSMHQRNSSVASVSTVASFATAAEEQSDDEEENEKMDQFSAQLFPRPQAVAPQNLSTSPRSDSAINMRKPNGSPSQGSTTSRVSSPGHGDLVTGLQTSKIYSILLESPRDEPQLRLNEEEKQLVYNLAASLQQVCASLKSTAGDQYERKEWRRRLDEARKLLNGEEADSQTF